MPARRIVLLVVASALAGLAALGLLAWAVVAALPHPATAAELLARPEGRLVYPGATVLGLDRQDEQDPLFEGRSGAFVTRRLATPDPMGEVVAWYDQRLKALGYAAGYSTATYTSWSSGASHFGLTFGRAVPPPPAPPGTHVFVAAFSVDPGNALAGH